jgi:hypothetical protein
MVSLFPNVASCRAWLQKPPDVALAVRLAVGSSPRPHCPFLRSLLNNRPDFGSVLVSWSMYYVRSLMMCLAFLSTQL